MKCHVKKNLADQSEIKRNKDKHQQIEKPVS